MSSHFICTGGCGGVSGVEGTCQAQDCADYNQPLKECSCTDGAHASGDAGSADASAE